MDTSHTSRRHVAVRGTAALALAGLGAGLPRTALADTTIQTTNATRTKLLVMTKDGQTVAVDVDIATQIQAVIGIAEGSFSGPTAGRSVPTPAGSPPGPALSPSGDTVGGGVDADHPVHRFPFQGRQGQRLEVWARRAAGVTLVPQVTLVDPWGAREAKRESPYGGQSAHLDLLLQSTGQYVLEVRGYADTTGPLSMTYVLDRIGAIQAGAPVAGEIVNPGQQKDWYRFTGTQGARVRIKAQRAGGVTFIPNVELVDPWGAKEDEDRVRGYAGGPAVAVIEKALVSSGVYTIVVSGYADTTGPYSVSLTPA
jgi:hypothetical protein